MKKLALALVLSLALVAGMAAQGQAIDSQGSFGLQFTMQGLGTFGVDGVSIDYDSGSSVSGIGARYFIISKLAFGLDLYLGGTSNPAAMTYTSSSIFGIRPAVSYYLVKKGPVDLYAGAYFAYGSRTRKTDGANPSAETHVVGYGALLGTEYFIMNGLSLGAEYSIGSNTYSSSTTDAGGTTTSGTDTSAWGVGVVSVYVTFYL